MSKHVSRKARASKKAWLGIGGAVAVPLGIGLAVFFGRSAEEPTDVGAAVRQDGGASQGSVWPVVDVYKTPTCGCCAKWVEHLQSHGFTVRTTDMTNLASVKASHRIPPHVESCHTAVVDGYVVEGHVPAADVQRLLTERPALSGLAVAGMPIGSPGMELPDVKPQVYDVMAFDKDGSARVFSTHGQ
ncbi:MAG: DUF411 domain-containing protein [Vicinamibacterales bacterium]